MNRISLVFCGLALGCGVASFAASTSEKLAAVPGVTVVNESAAYRVLEPWEAAAGATAPEGPFDFRTDNQCAPSGEGFCCQLEGLDGCQDADGNPINDGPYYAREFTDFNDFVKANLYWSEYLPVDMPTSECQNFKATNSSALLPRLRPDKALYMLLRDEANFGDICNNRGSTVMFCRSSGFFLRPSLEDEILPWGFTVNGMLGALDSPGFDITATEHCVP